MSNTLVAATAWIGFALHLIVGVTAIRSERGAALVPLLNLLTAGSVLAYWGYRWFGYLFRGVTWSLSDQALPLYALVVCLFAGLALANRHSAVTITWIAFVIDSVVLLIAVLFVTFFRMDRLI